MVSGVSEFGNSLREGNYKTEFRSGIVVRIFQFSETHEKNKSFEPLNLVNHECFPLISE